MKASLRVALIYLVLGFVWIYFSDYALSFLLNTSEDVRQIQSLKGWGFVTFSAILIYFLLVRELQFQRKVILEKIESDRLYQVILERIEDAVIVFNLDKWKIEFLSEQVSRLFEIPSKQIQTNPELLIDRVYEGDRARMVEIWMNQLRKNHTGLLYRLKSSSGRMKWALEHRLFIPAELGSSNKAVAVITDMTSYMENQTQLEKTIRENQILLTEVHHRVKNNLAVIISFLQLQAYSAPEATAEILEQSIVRIKAIALVHEKLYSSKNIAALNSVDYITSLVENIKLMYMRTDVEIILNIESIEFNILNSIPLGLMLTEMLTNSFRHAFPTGFVDAKITIQLVVQEGFGFDIIYSDNGVGFPTEFSPKKAETVGLSVIFSLCGQLKGREVEVVSNPNQGVRYHFSFPRPKQEV